MAKPLKINRISSAIRTFVVFWSEHLWCVESEVATLTRSVRLAECSEAKLPLVPFERVLLFRL